jgi:hypothetical protein
VGVGSEGASSACSSATATTAFDCTVRTGGDISIHAQDRIGEIKYVPLYLNLLALRHERTTIHKESVFTGGRLLLPCHLAVIDEWVVTIILLNLLSALLLPLTSLRLNAVGAGARTAHGDIAI